MCRVEPAVLPCVCRVEPTVAPRVCRAGATRGHRFTATTEPATITPAATLCCRPYFQPQAPNETPYAAASASSVSSEPCIGDGIHVNAASAMKPMTRNAVDGTSDARGGRGGKPAVNAANAAVRNSIARSAKSHRSARSAQPSADARRAGGVVSVRTASSSVSSTSTKLSTTQCATNLRARSTTAASAQTMRATKKQSAVRQRPCDRPSEGRAIR
mmetsp:Transcript_3163/g.8747  ORF Transcript_3163/g.8747 Transcript_3163/m.8747 type:complete len:215 (-) Transcript_3163:3011-3655(-)